MKVASFLVAAVLCNVIAYALDELRGLQGAAVGTFIALALCGVSVFLLGWARRANGQAILAAMMGSVLASFLILAASMVLLGLLWPELLRAGAITAVVVYLAYRFAEAFQGSRSRGDRSSGAIAGVLFLSNDVFWSQSP